MSTFLEVTGNILAVAVILALTVMGLVMCFGVANTAYELFKEIRK